MNRKAFEQEARKGIILYASSAKGCEDHLDMLSQQCSEKQWAEMCALLHETDVVMGETELATLQQYEKAVAAQEGREHRLIPVFESDREINRITMELANDHGWHVVGVRK